MKNITITLDERMAAWLRLQAAKHGMSVSRFVADLVHERMREARGYDEAMRRFLSDEPLQFEWADGHRPTREEINERTDTRGDRKRPSPTVEEPK
jgi:ribonuclease D